jgi:methionyl-tRNA formyltransferase
VAVVAAYGQILPPAMLEAPTHGCVNVHASLLPRFRGAAPIQHAILAGDAVTGVTIMQMDEGLDTGPMLLRRELSILPEDTAGSLHDRLADLGAAALLDALDKLRRGELVAEAQDSSAASHAGMLRKSDGHLDWSESAKQIQRRVAAMHPWPGAQTSFEGQGLKVHPPVSSDELAHDVAPGTVIEVADAGIRVACGEGSLSLFELQLGGRRRMPVAQFLHGCPIAVGTVLGEVD